jgi:hypothetical protein
MVKNQPLPENIITPTTKGVRDIPIDAEGVRLPPRCHVEPPRVSSIAGAPRARMVVSCERCQVERGCVHGVSEAVGGVGAVQHTPVKKCRI